ncbi:MAG: hypothetical protein COX77_01970 [Candidatus Komeilibacteria bacterium CG_4_10_14_0_2_um_filter_37_10]|uniref:Glycosyltransferase RgtA/B/C/D-like domain-containing protein n=1 Tax=Candidatus Komeilibacteria bacterium CG_4_10_14_0_2_um_filter_37_10 TaxID=1974470 RepID=A0A2M7VF95_9BACT|nr:MAG: hypothetical protein COX77_01970 [Candidatus Komeilibacteria bacterium CG_4_10_14_0_2_um_filter_37_10]
MFQLLKNNKLNILILLTVVLTFFVFSYHPLDADEGVVINGAGKMLQGQRLYQDFFEYLAPGSFLFIFVILKFFGMTYYAVKIGAILLLLLGFYFLYQLTKSLELTKKIYILFILWWLYLLSFTAALINHNVFSTITVILAFYWLWRFIYQQARRDLLLASSFSGLTIYFLQSKGLMIILAFLVIMYFFLPREDKMKKILLFLLPIIALSILSILFFGFQQFTNLLLVSSDYLLMNKVSYIFWLMAIFICCLIGFYSWWHEHNRSRNIILMLVILQFFLLLSIFNRPDFNHLVINIWPLLLIFIYYSNNYLTNKSQQVNFLISFLIVACILQGVNNFNIYHYQDRFKIIDNIVGSEQIFAHPFLPGLYFDLGKDNPYFTSVPETIQGNAYFLQNNYQTLIDQQPGFVITNYELVRKFNYQKNIIDDYIAANYQVKTKVGSLEIWERK